MSDANIELADELIQSMEEKFAFSKNNQAAAGLTSDRSKPISGVWQRLMPKRKSTLAENPNMMEAAHQQTPEALIPGIEENAPAAETTPVAPQTGLAAFVENHRDILDLPRSADGSIATQLAERLAQLADDDPRKFCEVLGELLTLRMASVGH